MQEISDKPKPNRVTCRPFAGFVHRCCPCGAQIALPLTGAVVGCPACHRRLVWKASPWKNHHVETVSMPGDHSKP